MKLTGEQKDLLSAIVVGLVSMILFILLMGTIAVWGQNAGQKVRSRLSLRQSGQLLSTKGDTAGSVSVITTAVPTTDDAGPQPKPFC